MGITCCYKCEERTATCHTTCEKYKAQWEESEKARKRKYLEAITGEHFAKLDERHKHYVHRKRR